MNKLQTVVLFVAAVLLALLLGATWELLFLLAFGLDTNVASWVWSSFGFAIGTLGLAAFCLAVSVIRR